MAQTGPTTQRPVAAATIDDQRQTIALLSNPSTYGPGVEEVQRIDTHSAIVFLAGDRAYKLKRAVRYDYLDFSTLDSRLRSCVDEVRLNRRTAPDLYVGRRPITCGLDGALQLGGDGAAVDWVVEMARFDESAVFDRMAERGELDVSLMPALAHAVARLHAAPGVFWSCAHPALLDRLPGSEACSECPRWTASPDRMAPGFRPDPSRRAVPRADRHPRPRRTPDREPGPARS